MLYEVITGDFDLAEEIFLSLRGLRISRRVAVSFSRITSYNVCYTKLLRSRTTMVNPSEEAIKIGPLGIRFLLTGDRNNFV